MTADELALLRGVEAAPDDDLPRLVYADWLDEHGRHARAEFIRVQCELASIERRLFTMTLEEKRVAGPRRGELRRAERELLKANRNESVGPVPRQTPHSLPGWRFQFEQRIERGFLYEFAVHTYLNDDYAHAVELCEKLIPRPVITAWRVCQLLSSPERLAIFSRANLWREVDAVHMGGHSGQLLLPHELIPMTQPEYRRLKEFSASSIGLNPGHVCVIAERLMAPNLRHIDLSSNEIVDSGVAFLHRAVYAKSLQEIDLSYNPINRLDNATLTRERFPSLVKIDLTGCPIMPQSLAQLRAQLPGVEVIC